MTTTEPTVPEQAGKLLGSLAGAATVWSVDLALRLGLVDHIAEHPGTSAVDAAKELGLDPEYTHVLLRSAYAAEVLELDGDEYRVADHMAALLLDQDHPGYLGGAFKILTGIRETFLDLRNFAKTGEREWWSDFSPEWIDAVGTHCQAYYRRLVDIVVPQLPVVADALGSGASFLDLACGTCRGPMKVVDAFPSISVTAVDADRYSLDVAAEEVAARGMGDRFRFVESFLEDLELDTSHNLAHINVSLHEARDIDRVVERVHAALAPGGTFLVSEFPFPDREDDCRSIPARIMCGVQAFESHIGCQLLPASRFVDHLDRAGFRDVGVIDVNPMHVVIHGTR